MATDEIAPRHYADRRNERSDGDVLFDNFGWCILFHTDDELNLLWTAAYALNNGDNGPYPFTDRSMLQTTSISAPRGAAFDRGLVDNEFTSIGWDPIDMLSTRDLQIESSERSARWRVGGREFSYESGTWAISGLHAGVAADVSFKSAAPPFWYTDPSSNVQSGELWVNQFAQAEGLLRHGDSEKYVRGYGWHEHHTQLRQGFDPLELNWGRGLNFFAGFSESVMVYTHGRPDTGSGHGRLVIDGLTIPFDGGESFSLEPTEYWRDPRSWFSVPSRWRLLMESSSVRVNLEIAAAGRASYIWPYKHGASHQYWYLCEASGFVQVEGSDKVPIVDMLSVVNINRGFHRRCTALTD